MKEGLDWAWRHAPLLIAYLFITLYVIERS